MTMQDIPHLVLEEKGYEVRECLGRGGCGSVFHIFHKGYQEDFAVKIMDISTPELSRNLSPYMSEINSLMNLIHTNIIHIYKHFTERNFLFIVLEYCPGGNLHNLIKDKPPLPFSQRVTMSKEIIEAIFYCHSQNISHGDIKPSNILIDRNNRTKLADFGLSKTITSNSRILRFSGTSVFMAPEIMRMEKFDPKKADIWALGITIHFIFTGRYPFESQSNAEIEKSIISGAVQIDKDLPPEIYNLISTILKVDPNERPDLSTVLTFPVFASYCTKAANIKLFKPRTKQLDRAYFRHAGANLVQASSYLCVKSSAAFNQIRMKKNLSP